MPDADLVAEVADLARRGAELALAAYDRADLGATHKADGSVVTDADKAVEAFLRAELAARFPGDAILGEEEGAVVGTTGRRWILDPIDGTEPYARRVVTWATLLALEVEGRIEVGACATPGVRGLEVVAAGRGLGCTWDGRPARVSERTQLRSAVVGTSSTEWWPEELLLEIRATGARIRTWGNGYGLALVATGRIDAFLDIGVKPWDVATAPVLLAEAGGGYDDGRGGEALDTGISLSAAPGVFEALRTLLPA